MKTGKQFSSENFTFFESQEVKFPDKNLFSSFHWKMFYKFWTFKKRRKKLNPTTFSNSFEIRKMKKFERRSKFGIDYFRSIPCFTVTSPIGAFYPNFSMSHHALNFGPVRWSKIFHHCFFTVPAALREILSCKNFSPENSANFSFFFRFFGQNAGTIFGSHFCQILTKKLF